MPTAEFEAETGWELKPEGACRADVCIPLPPGTAGDEVDLESLAKALGMPLVVDEARGLYCLGPRSGGRALESAVAPDLRLPGWHGDAFDLATLRGRKVLLLAWASW